ncbi:sensor histidine kinase [Kineosporia succinea]|uniref:histidine kinase n=1 Tax=Kineosporia succinea TaxID=84632 RepID=A0ABT9P1X1_9ACTN|nr:histidine kinase [Kineosporia succinea]MDP9826638.1 signal transduction histidine kinase [Kineosporia succinea]
MTSQPPTGVTHRAGASAVWGFLRERVLPPVPAAIVAAVLFAATFGGLLWLTALGWEPMNPDSYLWLSAVVTVVLLTRDRFPRSTLVLLVLLYPQAYGGWLNTDLHVLPFLLAGYTVASQGAMAVGWTLLLCEAGVLHDSLFYGLDPQWWTIWTLFDDPQNLWGLNVSRILTLSAVVTATVLLGAASYRQRRANEELRHRQEELERLRQIETDQMVAAERTRIARELHDVVAHHISAVVLRAQAADRVADARPEQLREAVRWIAVDGQQTLAAMRQVVKVLRSADSAASLVPQTTLAEIPEIAGRMEAVGMPVELRLPPLQPILPAAVELAAVRIIQESLTNALVHARAGRAMVVLQLAGDSLLIEVHDDGGPGAGADESSAVSRWTRRGVATPRGIAVAGDPPETRRSSTFGSGHGLVGMRERAASCSGTLEIGHSSLGGWLVRARLSITVGRETPAPRILPQAV